MLGYITKIVKRFKVAPTASAASLAVYTPRSYGAPNQLPTTDTSAPRNTDATKTPQAQVGCLLYYARGVDCTILPVVTNISSRQSAPTQAVADAMTRLLHYCARYPDNCLIYHTCPMKFNILFDASYLSRPQSRSVAGSVNYNCWWFRLLLWNGIQFYDCCS